MKHPGKTIRLLLTFYRSFLLSSTLVTFTCLYLFYRLGVGSFFVLFWLKLATLGLTFWYINSNRKREFYYYRNLGVSGGFLWAVTLCFDFALFLLLLIQTYSIR